MKFSFFKLLLCSLSLFVIAGCNHDSDQSASVGAADSEHSSITASPNSLVADGASQSTVTVFLADVNQNFVTDGTEVTLISSAGSISSANPSMTTAGRATFTLVAPTNEVTAQLGIVELADLSANVNFIDSNSSVTGDPANITLSVVDTNLFVNGVGKKANTTLTIEVLDAAGNAITESSYGDISLNNLRVALISQPNGGEFLSGRDAAGAIVTTQSSSFIDIRTDTGVATVNIQSGTTPGVLEVRVTALLDAAGAPLASDEQVVASMPQIVIAAGPPHTISLTDPMTWFNRFVQPS